MHGACIFNSPQASVSFYPEIEGTKLTPGAFLFLLPIGVMAAS